MKKHINLQRNSFFLCAVTASLAVLILLSTMLFSTAASSQEKETPYYPEPSVRPDIRDDAVWDTELGMYISGDYVKDDSGKYVLDIEKFNKNDPTEVKSPEEEWLVSHENSKNAIDIAILKSVELSLNKKPSFSSTISPRDSDVLLKSINSIPATSLPELWKRACLEPAFRPLKLVALEKILDISFSDLGLYDSLAQKIWYESFIDLKTNLLSTELSAKNVADYGNLLIPKMVEKFEAGELKENELTCFASIINNIDKNEFINISPMSKPVEAKDDIRAWISQNSDFIAAINEVIKNNWDWAT